MFNMQKKLATVTDEYRQQQELLEKLQEKGLPLLYCLCCMFYS